MAKALWKGSIIDTYNKNDKFGGRENDDVKGVNKANGVDFLQNLYAAVESVEGFVTNKNPKDRSATDFNMVEGNKSTKSPFLTINTNVGFKWDSVSGISPYNNTAKENNYSRKVNRT